MLKKVFLALIACLAMTQVWADDAFRNHRYDSFQATPVTENSIVFVGNSITNMQPWAELFTAENVINRGNSGGFSWEILSNIQSFITRRPAKVFIMIGTNDMNVTGYTPEAVVANVRQAVKHIQKESPTTQVYIESVMASTNGSRTIAKGETLNSQLQEMATEMGVTYVDYFEATRNIAGGGMSYDNLHPHVTGVYAWTNAVAPYVGTGVQPVLPASPTIYNGGQSNSYGARTSVFGQLPVTANDVLFIGDEFVHSGEWQELLGNPNVKNRGTGWGKWGPDITYQTTCVPYILQGLASNVAPKQILLMVGTQNLTSSSANLTTFKTNYENLIAAIRAKAPTTKITLVSEIPYGPSATSLNINNLTPINTWLKEKADADATMDYCDLYSILTDASNTAISKYLNSDQYVTGLGYQACARELAKYIDGCTVMTEEEAENYYNLIAARETLSNAIDAIELGNISVNLDEYYALLANNSTTVAQLEAAGTSLSNTLRPTTGKWYKMAAKRNGSVYFTKATSGTGFIASATLDENGNSYWQLVERSDGTYDIQNGTGYYAVPTATHNVQLNLSTERPSTGWSVENCDVVGAFNIAAMVGTTSINCCMNLTGANLVYNWITDRESDQGCQIFFSEVDYTPSGVIDTYNVPFKRNTIKDGEFTGAQWWYNIKIKDQYYFYDNGEDDYMSLNRTTPNNEDDMWAFVGSDQKGYTIYNKKYGTSKVLAAPSTISYDNGSVYVKLVDAANVPAGYETRWQFETSDQIADVDGYFMYSFEQTSHKVNDYANSGKLSFWLGGAGAGSTIAFEFAEATMPITLETGTTYRDGAVTTTGWVSQWKSETTDPFQVTFGTSYNNMSATDLAIASGMTSGAWSFTLSDTDYYIKSYTFEVKGTASDQVITPNGASAVSLISGSYVTVNWENDEKGQQQASFTFTGTNAACATQNIAVVIRKTTVPPEPQFNVFEYGSTGNTICYRIPAIATANNGDVIAVADYRYGGSDIGFGRVSLRYRISKDNGQTWGDIQTLQESVAGSYGVSAANDLWAGFGDPCIVADRESGEVIVQSCCGNVSYPAGTWDHHQGIAQFRSYDNGETWEEYPERTYNGLTCRWVDVSDPIYEKFKNAGVTPAAMFVGSGRIFQSRFTKVGSYYRIYCVVLLRTASTSALNYVLYSDDFGRNWELLGGDNVVNAISSGDEPKCEELPDGSILVSSRAQGRLYNIFHFSNVEKGEGQWMSQAQSMNSNNGICEQGGNPTNGEIFLVPVVRKADNTKMWMALQSVPFGSGRANVGIYYKALESYADFNSPANFAKDWDGRHQSSRMGSAYSTITLQHDNTIGFLYEESTFGKDYTIVYKNYTIEDITDDEYEFDTDPIAPFDLTANGIDAMTDDLSFNNNLGGLKEDARTIIEAAIATFKSTPNQANYLNIFDVIANAPTNELDVTKYYIIRNTTRVSEGAYAMYVTSASDKKLTGTAYNASSELQQWGIEPCGIEGQDEWYYLYNKGTATYVMNLLAKETPMYTTADKNQAGLYKLQQISGDHFAMVNQNPTTADYPAIHLPQDYTSRMVAWTPTSPASQWIFEITDISTGYIPTGIDEMQAETTTVQQAYDLQGRAVVAPKQGLYIINRKKVILK